MQALLDLAKGPSIVALVDVDVHHGGPILCELAADSTLSLRPLRLGLQPLLQTPDIEVNGDERFRNAFEVS
jgi:hypothetical protein